MISSLYVHTPFCRQKCDYCDFYSIPEKKAGLAGGINPDDFVRSLLVEAEYYVRHYAVEKWSSIYLGGGTPGILESAQLEKIIQGVLSLVPSDEKIEITVEVNPENVTEEKIKILEKCGVSRISMGIQAFDDRALKAVNRISDCKTVKHALNLLDSLWNGRLSVDFIAGLPSHTYKSFESQFELLNAFKKIDHVSLYTLTVEEGTPLDKNIKNHAVEFSQDKADRMWIKGKNILKKLGFCQYEVSNFAKKGFESIHNSGYWKQCSYIGIGPGAAGTVYDFEGRKALRWTDRFSIPCYIQFFSNKTVSEINEPALPRDVEILDFEVLEFEFLMMGFRTISGVSANVYKERFGRNLSERIGAETGVFADWKRRRLAGVRNTDTDVFYSLNERGLMLLNRFLEELL